MCDMETQLLYRHVHTRTHARTHTHELSVLVAVVHVHYSVHAYARQVIWTNFDCFKIYYLLLTLK